MVTRAPLILDTDGGVDDAQALLMLLAAGVEPMAVTTVFGNVTLDHATANMLAILTVAGADVPVFRGAERPLNGAPIDARHVHGAEGLGTLPRPPTTRRAEDTDAVTFLRQTLRKAATGEKVDLLMIGPLTNLALALRTEPGIVEGIGQLTIMGGTIFGRGNTTPAAEFNIFADPEAAQIVLTCGAPTLIAPWETCLSHAMPGAQMEGLFAGLPEDDPCIALSVGLGRHARSVAIGYGRGDLFSFVDPLAAAAVIDPGVITAEITASVDVALAPGITRGMTVVDPSGRLGTPPVRLIQSADLGRLVALYAASVRHSPRNRP